MLPHLRGARSMPTCGRAAALKCPLLCAERGGGLGWGQWGKHFQSHLTINLFKVSSNTRWSKDGLGM